jgi:hypothetical protein
MRVLPIALALLAGCVPPPRKSDLAASDVEIERAILWEFRNDRKFDGITVDCRDRVATLRGIVTSKSIAAEALERARKAAHAEDYDARVLSDLEVREK